jgi:adenosylhomocysteine nucleosidase
MMASAMSGRTPSEGGEAVFGVLAALPEELGRIPEMATGGRTRLGLELCEASVSGVRVLACVGGVGKVLAARAATILIAEGATRGVLVVGTCGGLRQKMVPGTLLHCTTAIQTDLAHPRLRRVEADARLREAWRAIAPGPEGAFLTADRPVLSLFRRLRLARTCAGFCAADMETAAAGAVAAEAGVPWAALRTVTDRATGFGAAAFRLNYPTLAGRAADTLAPFFVELARRGRIARPA